MRRSQGGPGTRSAFQIRLWVPRALEFSVEMIPSPLVGPLMNFSPDLPSQRWAVCLLCTPTGPRGSQGAPVGAQNEVWTGLSACKIQALCCEEQNRGCREQQHELWAREPPFHSCFSPGKYQQGAFPKKNQWEIFKEHTRIMQPTHLPELVFW